MIPNSNWQRKQQHIEREKYRPGAGEVYSAVGLLLEVWDQERLASQVVPKELADRMKRAPGLLFGLVQIGSQKRYLAFHEPEDHLYLVYGNHLQLEGRRVRVEYQNASIENGRIHLQKIYDQQHINLGTDLQILDIGAII